MLKQLEHAVMVGISTEQNTTNLVPFTQFKGNSLFLAETDEANAALWSNGPAQIMKDRKTTFSLIPIGKGDDLPYMTNKINEFVKNQSSICWNFGGGQKMQQLALFNLFLQRLKAGKEDWACYSDPKTRTTHIITTDDQGDFENKQIATDAHLTLEEIILIFGNKLGSNPGQLLWSRFDQKQPVLPLTDDDVSWFYEYNKRQRMFEHYDLEKVPNSLGKAVYPEGWTKLGDYFDKVVQYHVTKIIEKNKKQHTVNEVWANVHVFNSAQGGQIAEYDVLLVTNFGTVIPLDAKSGMFKKKDEDARLHNLRNISGRYTTFYAVFPYFPEDLREASVLHKVEGGRELLQQPFTMQKRGSRMLVLSEKGNKGFSLTKGKKNKISIIKENDKATVQVHTLESILDQLNLRRS